MGISQIGQGLLTIAKWTFLYLVVFGPIAAIAVRLRVAGAGASAILVAAFSLTAALAWLGLKTVLIEGLVPLPLFMIVAAVAVGVTLLREHDDERVAARSWPWCASCLRWCCWRKSCSG